MTEVSMGGKFPVFQSEQKREAVISCLCLSVLSGQTSTNWLNKTFSVKSGDLVANNVVSVLFYKGQIQGC